MGELFRYEPVYIRYMDTNREWHYLPAPIPQEIVTSLNEYEAEVDAVVNAAHEIENSASDHLNSILEDERDNDFRDSIYLDDFLNSFSVRGE